MLVWRLSPQTEALTRTARNRSRQRGFSRPAIQRFMMSGDLQKDLQKLEAAVVMHQMVRKEADRLGAGVTSSGKLQVETQARAFPADEAHLLFPFQDVDVRLELMRPRKLCQVKVERPDRPIPGRRRGDFRIDPVPGRHHGLHELVAKEFPQAS